MHFHGYIRLKERKVFLCILEVKFFQSLLCTQIPIVILHEYQFFLTQTVQCKQKLLYEYRRRTKLYKLPKTFFLWIFWICHHSETNFKVFIELMIISVYLYPFLLLETHTFKVFNFLFKILPPLQYGFSKLNLDEKKVRPLK